MTSLPWPGSEPPPILLLGVSIIERVSPGPSLELLGRRPADGWVVRGDPTERGLFEIDIPDLDFHTLETRSVPSPKGGESGGRP
jgi:hypothetical protein